ncbi:MAG: short-chain dehydrogenase [Halioglobus sp.]|nr:short-chain dehydrogenase [Halioglobus sp.]|tara:strand:- start:5620 stop:6360 length:741 start_codon:yes stop_codon:yes gene_type:complete
MKQNIVVFGATSAICTALLRLYAKEGASLFLAARNNEKLAALGEDLVVRGATVAGMRAYDFNDWPQHEGCLEEAATALGEVDLVIVAHGSLPQQADCDASGEVTWNTLQDNFSSTAIILQQSARLLAAQGRGTLAAFTSVAGDRGRKSNYTYGSTKAGLDAMLEGLRGRFYGSPVAVVTIKPGMIVSPMTADMEHGPLWSTPEAIAPTIKTAISRGRALCYAPGYWRLIMWVIRALPLAVLARLPI